MPVSLLPHHDGSALYVSNLNPAIGETVEVRLRIPECFGPVARVAVRSLPDTEQWVDEAVCLGSVDGWQWWSAQIVVANPRHRYRWLILPAGGRMVELSQGGSAPSKPQTSSTSRCWPATRRRRGWPTR